MPVAFVAKLVLKPDEEDGFDALQKKLSVLTHDHESDTLDYDFLPWFPTRCD